jgi:hypothetical protein
MKAIRLFAALVMLTAASLATVWLQVDSARTAYRVHHLHADHFRLRQELREMQKEIATYSNPVLIEQLVELNELPVAPRRLRDPAPEGGGN